MKITDSLIFVCDKNEFSGVQKIAKKVSGDVKLVFDFEPEFLMDNGERPLNINASSVIFGTVGKSVLIDEFEKNGKINLSEVRGKREVYGFFVLENTLVIAGSDKRGTIYGLFHLSELLGVSPLVNWCDVLPAHKDSFTLTSADNIISREPSVRFRGFFINDEWPATGNWCNKRFGGFNAKMYEPVFELLLRMKGNYLWPAMWSARFSDDGPGLANAELADEMGVIMGASHHEPCCRAGEEYRYLRGKDSVYGDAWNFRSNEKGITKFWEDGLKRSGKFENVITVGMRGEADTAIMQNATLKDNIDLLRDVIATQNRLIRENVNPDIQQVPRMLALYKEVEPYFYGDKKTKGLMDDPELDGVTLMLCDDNHGNLRTVPTEKMRNHKGGYGMYYHFDYHGSPYSYEWINTTALPKVKEQMTAAYDFGIRDLWIVNVGDVMTNEFPLNYFLDLAYDYEKYSDLSYTTQKWTREWVDFNFSALNDSQKDDIEYILNTYTKLAHQRRTECLLPETYHPVNFGESDRMLQLAENVISKAEGLDRTNPGLFLQVIYPAIGNMNIFRMQLLSGKNKWFAKHGLVAANYYANRVRKAYEIDQNLVNELDKIADGKFYAMGWSEHFGFKNWCEAANVYPTYTYVEPTRKKRFVCWIEGQDFTTTGQDWTIRTLKTDAFKNPDVEKIHVYVANCGKERVQWKLSCTSEGNDNFFKEGIVEDLNIFSENTPEESQLSVITLEIDRAKLAASAKKVQEFQLKANDGHGANLLVNIVIDANVPDCNYPEGTYVQTGDYISMEAVHYSAKNETAEKAAGWEVLPDYGKTLGAVKAYPVDAAYPKGKDAPFVQYNFALKSEGVYTFDFFLNPSNPAYKDNKLQFIAEINGQKILKDVVDKNFAVGDNQEPWGTDVTNNIRIADVYAECKAGLNELKVYPVTPNIVLEKIVVYQANSVMPDSYLGAPETYRVHK